MRWWNPSSRRHLSESDQTGGIGFDGGAWSCIGVPFRLMLGVVVGVITGNLALGMEVGIAIGVGIGGGMGAAIGARAKSTE